MLSQPLPDFDSLWDYSQPDQTETRFRQVLLQIPEDEPAFLELLTQIGRAQGLQHKFEKALEMAKQVSEDFYAVDALHMLAIVAPPEQSLKLNLQAIQMAESSRQEKAQGWLGSLYNNLGWSYHNLEKYAEA